MVTIVELIELQARGMVDVMAQIDAVKDSTVAATDAAVVLNKVLNDPRNRDAVKNLEAVRMANAGLLTVERDRARLAVTKEQAYGRDAMHNVRRQVELQRQELQVERDLQRLRLTARASLSASPPGIADVRDRLALAKMEEAQRRFEASQQLSARREYLQSPEAKKEAAGFAGLTRQTELADLSQKRLDTAAQRELAAGANGVRDARFRLGVEKEVTELQKLQNRINLTARYGRTGGGLAALGESRGFQLATGTAAAGSAGVLAAAASGFSDTVEMHQFRTAVMFANRELAGAFVPALRNATAGVNIVRLGLGQMTGTQQKMLATTVLTIAALGALNIALYRTAGLTLMGAAAGGFGRFGRLLGGGGGGGGNSLVNAAVGTTAANQAGGFTTWAKSMGARAGVGLGLHPAVASAGIAPVALAGAGVLGGYLGFGAAMGKTAEYAWGGQDTGGGYKKESYYDTLRRDKGMSKLGAGISSFMYGGNEMLGDVREGLGFERGNSLTNRNVQRRTIKGGGGVEAEMDQKSAVTPILPTLFSDAGGTWEEFALAGANSTSSKEGSGDSTLGEVLRYLEKRFGTEAPADNPQSSN